MFLLPLALVANLPDAPVAGPPAAHAPVAAASVLAEMLAGPVITLTTPGMTAPVSATAEPKAGRCALRLTARSPAGGEVLARQLDWRDVAWVGTGAGGAVRIAFYDHEGRLPVDSLTVAPRDPALFRSTLAAVVSACRSAAPPPARVVTFSHARIRSCYFAGLPQLQLIEEEGAAAAGQPPRAMLTLLARERPEAELQVLFERPLLQPAAHGTSDPIAPAAIAFVYAEDGVDRLGIADAGFALDAAPAAARHSVAIYGDTRVRIMLGAPAADGTGAEDFARRLADSDEVRLALRDTAAQEQAAVHFDAKGMLAAATQALTAADWSCTSSAPAPAAPTRWAMMR